MTLIKFVFKFVICLAVIALAAVLTLPLWIGPVAKTAVNTAGPKCTKTAVSLGDFALNPYSGDLRIGNLLVGNPDGFKPAEALKLGNLEVSLDPLSLADDVIHIRLIRINDLFVSYVSNEGRNNFDAIMANVGSDKGSGDDAKSSESQDETPAAERGSDKPAKKVIIDRFELSGVTVQLGPIPMPVPPITLTDIGKKSKGVTLEEAWDQVFAAVMKSVGVMTEGLKSLQGALGDGVNGLNLGSGKVMESATKATKSTGKVLRGTADATKNAAKKSASAITDGTSKTVDAVGEGAKKAVDSLKNLW